MSDAVYSAIPLGPNFPGGMGSNTSSRISDRNNCCNSLLEKFRNDRHGYFRTAVILIGLALITVIISVIVHLTSSSSSLSSSSTLVAFNTPSLILHSHGIEHNGNVPIEPIGNGNDNVDAGTNADTAKESVQLKATPMMTLSLRGSSSSNDNSNGGENGHSRLLVLGPRSFVSSVEPKKEVQEQQPQPPQMKPQPMIVVHKQYHENKYLPEHGIHIRRSATHTTMTQQSSSSSLSSTSSSHYSTTMMQQHTSFGSSSSFVQVITTSSTNTLEHPDANIDADADADADHVDADADAENANSNDENVNINLNTLEEEEKLEEEEDIAELDTTSDYYYDNGADTSPEQEESVTDAEEDEGEKDVDSEESEDYYETLDNVLQDIIDEGSTEEREVEESSGHEAVMNLLNDDMDDFYKVE